MIFDLITIFLVVAILFFGAFTVLQFLGKFPRRTIDDVSPYLRPSEFEELESLLDPAHEANFRFRLSAPEFRAWQRKRLHLMREYLLRMSHNSLVLIEWGNMELTGGSSGSQNCAETNALAQELVQAATEFRLYSLLGLAKLKFWIVFHRDGGASLGDMRNIFGIDALKSYQRLKAAAGSLGLAHDYEYQQQLLARL